jgi:hypothetical protein
MSSDKTTDYELRSTDYGLLTTDYELPNPLFILKLKRGRVV